MSQTTRLTTKHSNNKIKVLYSIKTRALLTIKSLCTLEWISHRSPVSGPVSVDPPECNQILGAGLFRTHSAGRWAWVSELDSSSLFWCLGGAKPSWRTWTFGLRRPRWCLALLLRDSSIDPSVPALCTRSCTPRDLWRAAVQSGCDMSCRTLTVIPANQGSDYSGSLTIRCTYMVLILTVSRRRLLLVRLSAYVRVAVVEVAVPFPAVLAADVGISGGDRGERVALPYRYGSDGFFAIARQGRVTLQRNKRRLSFSPDAKANENWVKATSKKKTKKRRLTCL